MMAEIYINVIGIIKMVCNRKMAKEDVIKKIFGEDLLEMMIFKLRFSG